MNQTIIYDKDRVVLSYHNGYVDDPDRFYIVPHTRLFGVRLFILMDSKMQLHIIKSRFMDSWTKIIIPAWMAIDIIQYEGNRFDTANYLFNEYKKWKLEQ